MFFKEVSETKCFIVFLPNKISSFYYNPKSCRRFTERLKDNNEGMRCLFIFFKREKKVYMLGISTRCGGAQDTFVFFI